MCRPIHLRADVVDPALADPLPGVRVQVVVRLHAAPGVGAERVGAGVAPHAERADAELRAGPDLLDAGRHLTDQLVDVVPPPVGPGREVAAVAVVGLVVVEGLAGHRIGVEVVVEVDRVDLVLVHRVEHRLAHELADLGQPRVVVELAAVRHHPVLVLAGGVGRRQLAEVGVVGDAVRVEPGVQLQTAGVGLLDGRAQRVPAGVLALGAGEDLRPRLVRRGPQGVGGGPYLEDHGVQAGLLRRVEVGDQLGALLLRGQARLGGPVPVRHGRDPHAAHLPRRPPPVVTAPAVRQGGTGGHRAA